MSKNKLSGKSSLTIEKAPQQKEDKMGLIDAYQKAEMKSFRLSRHCITRLVELSKRYTKEAGLKISMSKVIEIAVLNAEYKSLSELLLLDK